MEGIVGTSPAAPADRLGGAAGRFLDAFAKTEGTCRSTAGRSSRPPRPQVLLDAIARSDGTRKDVVRKLFATDRAKTVLGPMSFDGNGDPRWSVEALYRRRRQLALPRPPDLRVDRSRRASWRGRPGSRPRPRRRTRRATSTTRRTCRAADRFTGESILETRLSAAAYRLSQFIGSPKTIDVACWSRRDWPRVADDDDIYSTFGFWMGDMPHWVHLSPETCRGIETLLHNRPAYPNAFTADAVQTLSHEMMHALGVDSEAEAECLGMQVSAVLAQDLGVPKHYALRLAHLNLENYEDLPPEYIDRSGAARTASGTSARTRTRRPGTASEPHVPDVANRRKCRLVHGFVVVPRDYCDLLVGHVLCTACSRQYARGHSQSYRAHLRFLIRFHDSR